MEKLQCLLRNMSRKKTFKEDLMTTQLNRCLNLFDLVFYGIGGTVGSGIYIITGTIMRDLAGPGVIISYLLAGIAVFLSSLCYSEFGARIPKTGSGYKYTYIIVGEFPAFLIGWLMLMQFIIKSALNAKTFSLSACMLYSELSVNNTMSCDETTSPVYSWFTGGLDYIAVCCIIVWTTFLCIGVKVSTIVNNVLTLLNISTLILIIALGAYYGEVKNLKNDNNGGFLPFGFSGVLTGCASCLFVCSGFEAIMMASEETKNPARNIPLASGITVMCGMVLYLGAASSLALMIPFNLVNIFTPFQNAFSYKGVKWVSIMVDFGLIVGLSASILNGLFSLSRLSYTIANDGLLFRYLGYVHPKTQTPLVANIVCGLLIIPLALIIKMSILMKILSIVTLISYTSVAISIIILRYRPVDSCYCQLPPDISKQILNDNQISSNEPIKQNLDDSQSLEKIGKLKERYSNLPLLKNIPAGYVGPITVLTMVIFCICDWLIIFHAYENPENNVWWIIMLFALSSIGFITSYVLLCLHEHNSSFISFQVPCIPIIPVLCIIINIGLMIRLTSAAWMKVLIWVLIGSTFYFCYGIKHADDSDELTLLKDTNVPHSDGGSVKEVIKNGEQDKDYIDVKN